MLPEYDVIVVGAGHAGCEAAAAAANLGSKVLLITMNMQTIAQMSCNPAMGGIAKGQIVREIDAMGGYSGIVSDKSMIQFRMLNRSKGPAMWSPRTQNDRMLFAATWREMLGPFPDRSRRPGPGRRHRSWPSYFGKSRSGYQRYLSKRGHPHRRTALWRRPACRKSGHRHNRTTRQPWLRK